MTAISGNSTGHFPGSFNDPSKHQQIYQYLENLKKDEYGWKKSVETIVTNNLSNVEEHFLLLQVLEDFLSKRYAAWNNTESINCIKNLLYHWIQKLTSAPDQPSFLVNKMAHIFSLVFSADFPQRWPTFMDDMFLSRGFSSVPLVIFYLKTLLAIDAEVVDRDIQRTQVIFDRNTKIKDCMRDICIKQMVESWFTILDSVSDGAAQSICLDVVAAYVDWIDVELVANDAFMPLVIARLGNSETSEAAIRAIIALMQKGMPVTKKFSLIMALNTVLCDNNLLSLTSKSDEEDVNRVGSLLNAMGSVLLDCQAKFRADQVMNEVTQCITLLEANINTVLVVLSNEDPELSELVINTVVKYAQLVRDDLSPERGALLGKIVNIALERFIMHKDLEVDGTGEEELEFAQYRRELKTLIYSIGCKRVDLVIAPLEASVNEIVNQSSNVPIRKLEAIAQLVFSLSELIPSNFVQQKEGWLGRAAQLPLSLLEHMPLDGRSAVVHVLYYEIACRYDKLLAAKPLPVVNLVASAFLDERGIAIPVSKVRSRIVYLFCRFVKAHKTVLSPLVSVVIQRLAPLLSVSPQADQFLTSEDQAYIFETTATLIIFGDIPTDQKVQFVQELSTNLANKFQSAITELDLARRRGDADMIKIIEQFMANTVGYCCRITKAFNTTHSMQNCQCVDIFITLINMFLDQLSPNNAFLLEPIRQLAHRMVVCLEKEVLPMLPLLMEKLSESSNTLDSMNQLLIFTHQIITKHKKESLKTGVNFNVILTTAARFSILPETDPNRTQEESNNLLYVRRSFLQLVHAAASNNMLVEVSGLSMEDFLEATTRLALGSDQTSQKVALQILAKVGDLNQNWWAKALRTALEVPSLAHISPSDAGSTLVVHEVSNTLQALRQQHAEEFTTGVNSLLPPQMAAALLNLLEKSKGKELNKQIMDLYAPVKS